MFNKKVIKLTLAFMSGIWMANAFADAGPTIGNIALGITSSFTGIGQLMAAVAYLAGFGLTIAAIFKFKQHKDNPQQVQLGTALTLLIVGVILIFLPSIIAPAGSTIFGSSATAGGVTGGGFTTLPGAK